MREYKRVRPTYTINFRYGSINVTNISILAQEVRAFEAVEIKAHWYLAC